MNKIFSLISDEKEKIVTTAQSFGFSICELEKPEHSDEEIEEIENAGLIIPNWTSTDKERFSKMAIYHFDKELPKKMKSNRIHVTKKFDSIKDSTISKHFSNLYSKKISQAVDELFELFKTFCKAEDDFHNNNYEDGILKLLDTKEKCLPIYQEVDKLNKKVNAGEIGKIAGREEEIREFMKPLIIFPGYTRTDDKNPNRKLENKSAVYQAAKKFDLGIRTIKKSFPKDSIK